MKVREKLCFAMLQPVVDTSTNTYSTPGPPELPNMCRDVYKWVHRLDLSYALRSPRRCEASANSAYARVTVSVSVPQTGKGTTAVEALCMLVPRCAMMALGRSRDCANGFLVAELLSRYFPKDVNMRSYENGRSSHFRNDNWMQIQDACRKHGFQLPGELVSGVMREQHGAAVELLELLYEHLTGKKLLRPGEVQLFRYSFICHRHAEMVPLRTLITRATSTCSRDQFDSATYSNQDHAVQSHL